MTQLQVQYTDHMGNDDSVVNAARVSFAKEASNFPAEKNHKLIRYLAEHKHEIPFAHEQLASAPAESYDLAKSVAIIQLYHTKQELRYDEIASQKFSIEERLPTKVTT